MKKSSGTGPGGPKPFPAGLSRGFSDWTTAGPDHFPAFLIPRFLILSGHGEDLAFRNCAVL
jgi:hypothetical protein